MGCLLGDSNAKVGDVKVRGMEVDFRVKKLNKNGELMLRKYAQNKVAVCKTFLIRDIYIKGGRYRE